MPFQFNDGEVMRSFASLVPNLRAQLVEDATLRLQQQQADTDQQRINAAVQKQRDEQARLAEYQRDLDAALLEGTPAAIRRLQTKYPEITKDAKEAFDAMDDASRQTTLTQMGEVWERVNGKDFEGAAQKLERRIAADRDAGEDTSSDQEILGMIRSGDPQQQSIASGLIAYNLRIIAGDKFDALTKALEPDKKTPDQLQYEYDLQLYGKAYADQAKLARDTKTFGLVPGGRIEGFGPDPSLIGGGTAPQGEQPASMGGGDPSGSGAVGLTPEQFRANIQVLGPQRAAAMTARNGIPVRVRTVQEANALPPGTLYATPTGELYTR